MRDLVVRQAVEADIPVVVELWEEAQRWLGAQGLDQWQYPVKMENVRRAIDERTCWLFETHDGEAIATVTVNDDADPQLWITEDKPNDALYVHRLVVRRAAAGTGLGAEILDWVGDQAAKHGKGFVRLDAWTNNPALHAYYERHGFRHVRTVTGEDIPSGALFERPAACHGDP